MAKNLMAKTRKVEQPYEVWTAPGWEWRVLKKYQADDLKPYARWFCAVKGPGTFGGYDYGDVYAAEVMGAAVRTEVEGGIVA